MLFVEALPLLKDNYAWLIRDEASGVTGVVDPSEPEGVRRALQERGWDLHVIVNTHHHWDHVGGNVALKEHYRCKVVGLDYRIPGLDWTLKDSFELGGAVARVMPVPGHTLGHMALFFPEGEGGWLFPGDTLFGGGCGRLFEGSPEQMWESLGKLAALPPATRVCCGHEYTAANLRFAQMVEPTNEAIARRLAGLGPRTVPSTLEEELATNPFLRAGDVREFHRRRSWKDQL